MTNDQGPNKMNLENRKAGERETRPTPETDAALADRNSSVAVDADFARTLERQRDEAREIAKKYEDRYFTMSELRNNASIVALEYKSQRDRLLEAISLALRTNGGPIGGADTTDGEDYVMVRAGAFAGLETAIAEVKGAAS